MNEREDVQDLIERHQGLVRSLALSVHRRMYAQPHVTLDDLVGYGQVGLAEAARDFDPTRGNQFSTFAYYRVRGAIYDGLSKMTWMGRAQCDRTHYEQMSTSILETESEQTSTANPGTAAEMRTVRNVSRALAVVYLTTHGTDAGGEPSEMAMADSEDPEVTEIAIMHEVEETLHRCIDALPPKAGALIRATYFEGRTLQDAGHSLGLSKSWASRLHARTLQELARSLRCAGVSR